MEILGIDIGGSGIKGAPVEVETGRLSAPRYRLPTPESSKPRQVARVVAEVQEHFGWQGVIGCGFPGVVRNGVVLTAANVHPRWVDMDAEALFREVTGRPVRVINDADAAGMAEVSFGAGKDRGVVLIVTVGTGLGTALFINGQLMPNLELGHIEINGEDAEMSATDAVRKRKKLSWKKWAAQLDRYLCTLERLVWPDLIILAGGVVKEHERFMPLLTVKTQIVPAQFLNEAGIVGAALGGRDLAV